MVRCKFFTTALFFLIATLIGHGQNSSDFIANEFLCDTASYIVAGKQSEELYGQSKFISKIILPSSLIAGGYLLWKLPGLDEADSWIQKKSQSHLVTDTKTENILIYSTYASYFGLDLIGAKAKNSFKDRLLLSVGSFAVGQGTTQLLKAVVHRERPDGSDRRSFPSGHTMTAFLGAHLVMKEYGHVSPWISVSAYTAATATGLLRVTNNKHWFSDIVAGAGIGILSVELSYLLMPYISKSIDVGGRQSSLSVSPIVSSYCRGVGLSYTF